MLRTPGFMVTSIGTLALAIGAVAGMFTVVNTVMLKSLPFPDSMSRWTKAPGAGG